jgi:hypothetical protein
MLRVNVSTTVYEPHYKEDHRANDIQDYIF